MPFSPPVALEGFLWAGVFGSLSERAMDAQCRDRPEKKDLSGKLRSFKANVLFTGN